MEINNALKITRDERKVNKVGSKVILQIDQHQEMQIINVKNMVNSWKSYNESANDYLKNQETLLEESIKVAKEQGLKMLDAANKMLTASEEDKKKFLDAAWEKEQVESKKIVEGYAEIVEATITEVKKKHLELLKSVKTEIKHNLAGIKLYGKVL